VHHAPSRNHPVEPAPAGPAVPFAPVDSYELDARESAPRNAYGYGNPPPAGDTPDEGGTHPGTPAGRADEAHGEAPEEGAGTAETYRLHRAVRYLFKGERVGYCLRQPRSGRVEIRAHADGEQCRCSYRGLARCADVWACPVCGRMISRQRAREVDHAAREHIAQGGQVAMLTLTMPHGVSDDLAELLGWLGDALRRTRRGNPWKRIARRFGIRGAITAKEATWGVDAGWHPHFHVVLLVDAGADAGEMEEAIAARWGAMVGKVCGREPNEHGCSVTVRRDDQAPAAAAAYLTKGAWSIGRELEGMASKRARHGRYTPLDIARRYADALEEGDEGAQRYWGRLFREYVEAYRGKKQTVWTPGLKSSLGVTDMDDEAAAEGEGEPEPEIVAVLGPHAWKCVRENHAEGALLRIAERDGFEGVRSWLARRGWDVGTLDPPWFEALGALGPGPPEEPPWMKAAAEDGLL